MFLSTQRNRYTGNRCITSSVGSFYNRYCNIFSPEAKLNRDLSAVRPSEHCENDKVQEEDELGASRVPV